LRELITKLDNRSKFKAHRTNFEFCDELKIKIKIQGVLFMKHLKICPKCHAQLKLRSDGEIQYCSICKYWTKAGTARLDSIMIFG